MVDPVVSVATALLRAQLPEVTLREGASVTARVASRGEGHGVLVLAGIPSPRSCRTASSPARR